MEITRDQITFNINELLRASQDFEQRMSEAGISQAHDWVFALREMLYDLRRLNILLADLFNTTDINKQSLQLLQEVVRTVRYEIIPHVEGHMDEVEQALTTFFPESEVPGE